MSEEHEPQWDKIYKLSETMDIAINDSIEKENISYIEIDIALLLLKEKLSQEKQIALLRHNNNEILSNEFDQPIDTKNTDFYR